MTNEKIALLLALGTESDLVDLNDWAVNTVRAYARSRGYNAVSLVAEETRRIDSGSLNLTGYLTTPRIGSHYLLSRMTRRAVFAVVATRRALS